MEEIGLSGSKPVETLVSLNVKLYTDHEELSSSKPQFNFIADLLHNDGKMSPRVCNHPLQIQEERDY